MEEGEELTGGIEYATELFLPATAERMARHMEVPPPHPFGPTVAWYFNRP